MLLRNRSYHGRLRFQRSQFESRSLYNKKIRLKWSQYKINGQIKSDNLTKMLTIFFSLVVKTCFLKKHDINFFSISLIVNLFSQIVYYLYNTREDFYPMAARRLRYTIFSLWEMPDSDPINKNSFLQVRIHAQNMSNLAS